MSYIEKTPAQASKADACTSVLSSLFNFELHSFNGKSTHSTQFLLLHFECYYKHQPIPSSHELLILRLRPVIPSFEGSVASVFD